jgi:beta-glucosidase
MCTHRHPLGGRNFESFSEDPYLAGKLAAQNVLGVQSTGVAATIKHFALNEQETQRLSVDEIISERALREIYLKPFEIAVKEAKPGAVMTAYNKVNGHHADSQTFLLQQVLRGEWGWDGLVMSDWGGTNSVAAALNAGLDLEMPGPTRWRKVEDVLQAIKAGELSEQTIDDRALHVLKFLDRQKCFDDPKIPDEQAINKPEHQALIREAGAKGIVLLKNKGGVLPLTKDRVQGKKIAVFGLAKECLSNGGGSASVNAHYKISPWDALSEAWKDDNVELVFAEGEFKTRLTDGLTDILTQFHRCPHFTPTPTHQRECRRQRRRLRLHFTQVSHRRDEALPDTQRTVRLPVLHPHKLPRCRHQCRSGRRLDCSPYCELLHDPKRSWPFKSPHR